MARRVPAFTAVLAAAFLLVGCARARPGAQEGRLPDAAQAGRLDRLLARLAAEHPDSVVGVLVRTAVPVGAEERAALRSAGLAIGTATDRVVTGRLRAGVAGHLAGLPFVTYVELARTFPAPRPPVLPRDSGGE